MPADRALPNSSLALLASVVEQLACPACLSPLLLDPKSLLCSRCGRVYPIVDGIPVLIAAPETHD